MFEVRDLLNGWVKKDGVNANPIVCDWPNLDTPNDFVFNPCLSKNSSSYNNKKFKLWFVFY